MTRPADRGFISPDGENFSDGLFFMPFTNRIRSSSWSLDKDYAISISSDAFVGFVASMSKNSFGVIPK